MLILRSSWCVLLLPLLLAGPAAAAAAPTALSGLRCEYLSNPLGIDVEKPRLSWILPQGARGRKQTAYQILVAATPEALRKNTGDVWDSGQVASEESTFVPYAGPPLRTGTHYFWKVRAWDGGEKPTAWSQPALWSMGLLQPSDWTARFIGQPRPADVPEGTALPSPWLRKTFTLTGKPTRAMASVNPLGYYELYVNGKKVDDHELSPAVSDYTKRNLYVTHDITRHLTAGKNVVALWLGRGWYATGLRNVIHDGPLVRGQFDITERNGSALRVITDATWKVRTSSYSPIGKWRFGDFGGERYDARLELPAWNTVALDDAGWQTAAEFTPLPAVTSAQMVEPNRITEVVKAVTVEKLTQGGFLIDLGANLTGWLELRIPAGIPSGTTLTLEYADGYFPDREEHVRRDGVGLSSYKQRDEVVTNGRAFTFRSRFNYHGFRWVRVQGTDRAPLVKDAKGHFIHTGYENAGTFASSNDLMNRIYKMVTRTYRALSLGGYVVDCPTRERLGYGGDAGTSQEMAMYNFGTGALYSKWAGDWRDAQHEKGDLPMTVPWSFVDVGGGSPMWGDFVVTMPWFSYLQYGDVRMLEENYPMMRKWLAYLKSEEKDGYLQNHFSHFMKQPEWTFLGDWLPPRREGEVRERGTGDPASYSPATKFINSLHYLYSIDLAGKIAAILGKPAEAKEFEARAAKLRRKLHEKFYDAGKKSYVSGEQPYLAFPLLANVVPPELRADVAANLEHNIRVTKGGHLDAGMHGLWALLKQLLDSGRDDLIYEMTSKTDYPSWGNMLARGGTTSWESWHSGTYIHDTLISIGSWFIQGLGGIRADEKAPGFRHFIVRPALVGDLKFVKTSYKSPYGMIVSNWELKGDTVKMDVEVPVGATATVYVPTSAADSVTEGGKPAGESAGVKAGAAVNGKAAYEVGAGRYAFTARR